MSLRDQPYLPLYVQDFLTDEKLIECSASATGVYIRLLCILHKQETYGVLLPRQKFRQNKSKYENFAELLSKQMPWKVKEIAKNLKELCDMTVIQITDNELSQKRMVKDGIISVIRANAGRRGAKVTNFAAAKHPAKHPANTENENENENENVHQLEYKTK